jgi:hypothetical protein
MDWMINAILLLGTLLGVAFMLVVLVAVIETADEIKDHKEKGGKDKDYLHTKDGSDIGKR